MSNNLKINEISEITGFSISTVSRVLAGKSNIRSQTRIDILACARKLGVFTALSHGRFLLNQLTIFAPTRAFERQSDIFYFNVIEAIHSALEPFEVRIQHEKLSENNCDIYNFIKTIEYQQCKSIIVLGIDDLRIYELIAEMAIPCVLINCYDKKMRLPSVSPHHQLIGEVTADYLLEQGHRNILSVLCLRRYTMKERLMGIRNAWSNFNLTFNDKQNLLLIPNFSTCEAEQHFEQYLTSISESELPTAILTNGDYMAKGIINVLNRKGFQVPEDISLMSVDGENNAMIKGELLTAFHVPQQELGFEAVRLLQQRIINPRAFQGTILLSGQFIKNKTVRKIDASQYKKQMYSDTLYDEIEDQ